MNEDEGLSVLMYVGVFMALLLSLSLAVVVSCFYCNIMMKKKQVQNLKLALSWMFLCGRLKLKMDLTLKLNIRNHISLILKG